MSYVKYNIYKSTQTNNSIVTHELLRNISLSEQPLRLTFFVDTEQSIDIFNDYIHHIQISVLEWYPINTPLISFIAQKPLDCHVALEVQSIKKGCEAGINYREYKGCKYIIIDVKDNHLLLSGMIEMKDKSLSIKAQSNAIFNIMEGIFQKENINLNQVLRQWNYISKITHNCIDSGQNYQQFNDSRSKYYDTTNWLAGYPAATGIGTQAGGIQVMFDAATYESTRTISLDNQLQIAAHKYSDDVLSGDTSTITTPKFERAKAIVTESIFGDNTVQIYISGTAAIRGEESLQNKTVTEQTIITIENIEYLISAQNLKKYNVSPLRLPKLQTLRVYLKSKKDYKDSHNIISKKFPTVSTLYTLSDVCREELLIEIEGLAE